MKIDSLPFTKLPFTSLFKSYTSDFKKLAPFFETDPFAEESVKKKLQDYTFKGNRETTIQFLRDFNSNFADQSNTSTALEKLASDDAIAVVTGQQLTLYGGPLFTVFKILTAIQTASEFEKKYGRPAVPVFWLADEDHDYDEVATLGVLESDDLNTFTLQSSAESFPRVAEMEFGEKLNEIREELKAAMYETDFSEELWKLLDSCYHPGTTFSMSFGKLMLSLFSKHGLILAGSNSRAVKELTKDVFKQSVRKSELLFDTLNRTSTLLLEKGFHNQVQVQPSNLFWIDDSGFRKKIHYEDNVWQAEGEDNSWSGEELISLIDDSPEKFSPNVFLRPVLQNALLPGAVYVAGPGEVAYYAQMKDFYNHFGLNMPVIMPRFSGTIIESAVERVLPKLPFSVEEYSERIEDLESKYIERSDAPDPEPVFRSWKKHFDEISKPRINQITQIDPTLKGTSEKVKANFFTELDKLKGKVYRSLKEQDSIQLQRIRKVKSQLFPSGNLQEREIAFIYFMNKYGPDIWNQLLQEMKNGDYSRHNIIHL